MYTVNFVGLNYFNACKTADREALIPNGTPGGTDDAHVPQHFASVFLEEDRWGSDDWWPDHKKTHPIQLEMKLGEFRTVNVIEFRIPEKPSPMAEPAGVLFQCKEQPLTNANLDEGLPKLQEMGFVLDDYPDAIAKVPLPGGTLKVFRFGASALVRWLISDHDDPIAITAIAGKERRRVTLKPSNGDAPAEIVFSNTVDLLSPLHHDAGNGKHGASHGGNGTAGMHESHGTAGHFVLYAKLDKERDESKFEDPNLPDPMRLTPLPFSHAYLAYLSSLEEVPDPPCTPSCC